MRFAIKVDDDLKIIKDTGLGLGSLLRLHDLKIIKDAR
jgi:hypothetical protein